MGILQEPVIVIPDLQGHYRQLEALVRRFRRDGYLADHWLVLLGDIPDRGESSRLTIEMVCSLVDEGRVVCLDGNHDFVTESAVGLVPLPPDMRLAWIRRWATRYEVGTLTSYGLNSPSRVAPLEEWVAAADALREAMPARHKRLFREMQWFAETDNLILVHAGLLPDIPWSTQRSSLEGRERNDPCGPAQIFSHALAGESSAMDNPNWTKRVVSGHAYNANAQRSPRPRAVLRVFLRFPVLLPGDSDRFA